MMTTTQIVFLFCGLGAVAVLEAAVLAKVYCCITSLQFWGELDWVERDG